MAQITSHPEDSFYANVKLLVIFDGENGSFDFKDYSSANATPSTNINTVVNTEEKVFRTGSGTFRLKDLILLGSGSGGDGGGE